MRYSLSSRLIPWLAYLAGWSLFALFFISEDEDAFLIVPAGYEILNPSLPCSAKDIEAAIEKRRQDAGNGR